jgi:hypothetical protein
MTACEEEEGMGNNAMSFALIVIVIGNGSIQAAQGQWQLISVRGHGAKWAEPIEQR